MVTLELEQQVENNKYISRREYRCSWYNKCCRKLQGQVYLETWKECELLKSSEKVDKIIFLIGNKFYPLLSQEKKKK